ncbi:MAG: pyruvate ferredoxin oxidoreductase [Desulfohalobiaceae bacterium]|nr:pyruvate ferredoxin oxidoreductase [Desulfohalobiaceae bacterium]
MNYTQSPPAQHHSEMLLGSDAIAYGVKLCRPQVIAAYPITPQTHIIETLSSMVDSGQLRSEYVKVESEMSAIAACFGSVAAGSRSFTATSSHGLALMHEMLHWFSGSRFPLVMVNANRALGAPWNIWTDQGDSLSQRDTGWLQIYCETAQEALDSIILSYWLTEKIMLPVMVMIDGFILSHTMEQLFVPEQDLVDRFLPAYVPPYHLDTENPLSFGAAATPDNFYNLKKALAKTMKHVPRTLGEGCARFQSLFGRTYQNLEGYRLEEAETVIVCSGALTGTVRIAVDKMRGRGQKVGLLKMRLFRPFPQDELLEKLAGADNVLAFNRAVSFGAGGTLSQELRSALYHLETRPRIFDVIISLGGKEVFPETVEDVVANMAELSTVNSNWF